MRTFFIFLIFLQFLNAQDFVNIPESKLALKSSYQVSSDVIYAKDIFPELDRNFKIANFPADKFSLSLKSVDIKLIFARFGYEIVSFEDDIVNFNYVSDMREDDAIRFLKQLYVREYGKSIEFASINIRPLTPMPKEYELLDFIPPSSIKKNSGNFTMRYRIPKASQIKKLPLVYEMSASILVLKAAQNIHTNDELDMENTRIERIALEKANNFASIDSIGKAGAKSFIREGNIISTDKLKSKLMVKKGEQVRAIGKIDGISIEVMLIARQNGSYNEIINAQNPSSGKIIRIRVIDTGSGEIL